MAVELATAYVSLVPSMKGAQGEIARAIVPGAGAAGTAGGVALGGGLVGSLKGALGPVAALTAGVFGAKAIYDWGKEQVAALSRIESINAQTTNAIKSTGGAAGVTAQHVEDLAGSLENVTATEAESIQEGANLLLTFKNIKNEAGAGNDIFDQTVTSMTDMARAMGTDAKGGAIQLGKALNDPVKGIAALSRVGITFSDDQKALITSLTESGNVMEAQKIILAELNSQFGGSGAAYAQTYAGKIDLLGHAWGTFGETLFTGVTPALGGVATVLTNVLNNGVTPFISKFTTGLGGLKALVVGGDFTGALRDAFGWEEDSRAVDFILDVREGITSLKDMAAPALEGLKSGFATIAPFLAPIAAGLGGVALNFLPMLGLGGKITQAFAPVMATLGKLAPLLRLAVGPVGLVVGALAALIASSPELQGALLGVATTLGSALGPIFATLGQTVAALMPIISTALASLGPVLTSLLATLAPALTMIVGLLGQVIAAVLPLAAALISQLAPVFVQLVSAILPPLVEIFGAVVGAVAPLVTQLVGVLVPVLAAVVAAVLPVISTLAGALVPVIQALLPIITTVFGVIASVVTAAMQIVQGIIQVVTGVISGNWSMVWQGLQNIVAGVWNTIKAIVLGAVAIVQAQITAWLGILRSVFSSAWNALSSVVSSAWSGITGAISSGVSSAVSFVAGLPGKITSALSGLGTLLVSVGRNMMDGFLDGVKAVAGKIGEAVLGPIKDSVEGVKSFLGIHSPSRLMRGIGRNTGEGMELGLLDQVPAIRNAFSQFTAATDVSAFVPSVAAQVPAVARMAVADLEPSAAPGRGGDTYIVYEAISARDTAMAVSRRQAAFGV